MTPAPLPQLLFRVQDAEPLSGAAVPTIAFRLGVRRAGGGSVRSATIGVRIDIASARRSYDPDTEARLAELFGEPERWGSTLRPLAWARTTALVGGFEEQTTVELPVALSYDFDVAAHKYLHALRDGEIPLDFMFNGTILYEADGRIQAAPVSWDREASYRLPVSVWRQAIDSAFPDSAWLRVTREVFDRLYAYRSEHALPSWEHTLLSLLDREPARRPAGVEEVSSWTT